MLISKKRGLIMAIMAIAVMLSFTHVNSNAAIDPSNPDNWQWYKYNNSRENNAVTNLATVINPEETEVRAFDIEGGGTIGNSFTPPLISGKYAYLGVGNRVAQIDTDTGLETRLSKESKPFYEEFKGTVNYGLKPPLYAEGKIFVQYSDGRILAVDAKTLRPLWETESVGPLQTVSDISYGKIDGVGYLYLGTWQDSQKGYLFCIALDGKGFYDGGKKKKVTWKFAPDDDPDFHKDENYGNVGFYWAGAYVSEKYIAIGTNRSGDYAAFYTLNPKTGEIIDAIYDVKGDVKSSVSYDGNYAYFTSKTFKEGHLNRVKISDEGKILEHKELDLDGASSGAPTVYKGRVYVGVQGKKYLDGDGHSVAVIDGNAMKKIYSVSTPGFPGESILLSTAYENQKFSEEPDGSDRVYLYFTCNKKPGTMYSFYDTPSTTENPVKDMSKLEFVKLPPRYHQYNISSISVDKDGNMYFKNDSGHLFKVTRNAGYLKSMKLEALDGEVIMDKGLDITKSDFDPRVVSYTGKQEGTSRVKLRMEPVEDAKVTVNNQNYTGNALTVPVNKEGNTNIEIAVTKGENKRIYNIDLRAKGTSADLKGIFVNYELNVPPWTDKDHKVEIDKVFTSGELNYSTILSEDLKAKGGNIWFVADDPNSKIKVMPVENWDEKRLNGEGNININSSANKYQGGATFFAKLYPKNWNRDAKLKIVVTSENFKNKKTYNFTISNQIYVSDVKLNKNELKLNMDTEEVLEKIIVPNEATIKDVTWKSSNKNVATVDQKGKVRGISPGEADITVTTKDKGKQAICKVTVVDPDAKKLPKVKADGIKTVEKYLNLSKYRKNEQNIIKSIIEKAKSDIENAKSVSAVNKIVKKVKTDLDKVPTKERLQANTWTKINNKWYYFDQNGKTFVKGWKKISNKWYYFDKSGAMNTGWLKENGEWYYLQKDGSMATGWLKVNGSWYYMNSGGSMKTGWLKLNNKWYYLSSSGAMKTGWLKESGKWYYLQKDGSMATGWLKLNNKWYHLSSSGVMNTGWYKVSGKWYFSNSSGVWIK